MKELSLSGMSSCFYFPASIPIDDNEAQNDLFREVTIALDENADMDEKNRNLTATKALLNYFSMLGQPTMTDDFDYQFVDTLCQKAGNLSPFLGRYHKM